MSIDAARCNSCGEIGEFYPGRDKRCKKCHCARSAAWRLNNKERHRASVKRYADEHKEQVRAYIKLWVEKNRGRVNRLNSGWRLRNPAKAKTSVLKYRMKNPHLERSRVRERQASQLKATPKWSNRFFVQEAYHLAELRNRITGIEWHVDHIVPLKSKIVCGLHAHTNIQVIPAKQNMSKGNYRWPDMP